MGHDVPVSAHSHPGVTTPEPGRPAYWAVVRGTFWGQFFAVLLLMAASFALTVLGLVGTTTKDLAFFWPWVIDGPWSLVASLGWAALVVAPIAWFVRFGVGDRTDDRLAYGWAFVAVAVGGYGALAAVDPGQGGALVILAVVATAGLVRGLAFERAGAVRRWPLAPVSRRVLLVALTSIALVAVLPYAVLHPFHAGNAGGDNATSSSWRDGAPTYSVKPGKQIEVFAQLELGRLPVDVERVTAAGVTGPLVVSAIDANRRETAYGAIPRTLPLTVPGRGELSLWLHLGLRGCPAAENASIDAVRVGYRTLGIRLTQTVRLDAPITLRCG